MRAADNRNLWRRYSTETLGDLRGAFRGKHFAGQHELVSEARQQCFPGHGPSVQGVAALFSAGGEHEVAGCDVVFAGGRTYSRLPAAVSAAPAPYRLAVGQDASAGRQDCARHRLAEGFEEICRQRQRNRAAAIPRHRQRGGMFTKSAEAKLRAILQTFKKSFSERIGANCITPDRARADFLPALNDDEAIRRQASQRTLSRSPNQGGEACWTATDESCIDHVIASRLRPPRFLLSWTGNLVQPD
jgi:hypothetical protein